MTWIPLEPHYFPLLVVRSLGIYRAVLVPFDSVLEILEKAVCFPKAESRLILNPTLTHLLYPQCVCV